MSLLPTRPKGTGPDKGARPNQEGRTLWCGRRIWRRKRKIPIASTGKEAMTAWTNQWARAGRPTRRKKSTRFPIQGTNHDRPLDVFGLVYIMEKDKSYRIIGMMSGTSLDGIDLAFCHFSFDKAWKYELIAAKTYPYNAEMINLIASLQDEAITFLAFKKMEIKYSEFLSKTIQQFIYEQNLQHIDYVSLHGHTIFHQPQQKITVQIANLPFIAAHLKLNVIGNFREYDVMCGGQGAPLVPFGYQLFGQNIFLNFGGIANVGYKNSGWDISYCNLILNYYAKVLQNEQFDRDGAIGRKGNLSSELKEHLNNKWRNTTLHSLGRQGFQALLEDINQNFSKLDNHDILYTFYVFLAEQINRNIEMIKVKNGIESQSISVLCSGGGAKNIFLLQLLNGEGKGRVKYILSEDKVVDFKEAIIFAYLGLKYLENMQNCKNGIGGMLAKGTY